MWTNAAALERTVFCMIWCNSIPISMLFKAFQAWPCLSQVRLSGCLPGALPALLAWLSSCLLYVLVCIQIPSHHHIPMICDNFIPNCLSFSDRSYYNNIWNSHTLIISVLKIKKSIHFLSISVWHKPWVKGWVIQISVAGCRSAECLVTNYRKVQEWHSSTSTCCPITES